MSGEGRAVVLVQPATNVFDSGKAQRTLPLSLLSAARYVTQRHPVKVVDLRAGAGWRGRLAALLEGDPICVGVTSITGNQILSALDVTRAVRDASDVPIVWGGIHASLFPDQVLSEPAIDYVVRKEGEIAFAALVERIAGGQGAEGIPGVSYRDGSVVHNDDADFLDLDTLPDVPYDAFGEKPYFLTRSKPTLYLETSRGCFSRCTYCYNASYHKSRWRGQSADKVLERLDRVRSELPDVRHLSLVDDNYFGDLTRATRIAEALVERGRPFTYQVQGAHIQRVAKMSEESLRLLKDSGCERLDMGIESGSPRILATVNKQLDLDGILEMNRRLARIGITPWFNFMVGFPGETEDDMDATRRMMLRILDDNPDALLSPVYQVVPYPGTALFAEAEKVGFRAPTSLDGWKDFHSGGALTPWNSEASRRRNARLYFLSIFFDRKLAVYDTHFLYRWLAALYRPIARLRLRKRWLALMPEASIFHRLFDVS